jgi:hypothetical protein
MTTMTNNELWTQVLGELRLAMTTATFDTWVAGTDLLSYDPENGRMLVGVANSYALDWLQHRLIDVIARTATAQAGRRVEPEFTLKRPAAAAAERLNGDHPHPTNPTTPETAVAEEEPPFVGFQPYRSDFTQVPKQYFEVVMRKEKPVVQAFVLAVIDQTVGVIVNYNTGERREWWEASYPEIMRVAGIKSKASVTTAVRAARASGYVIRRDGHNTYKYRHRWLGEPIDVS